MVAKQTGREGLTFDPAKHRYYYYGQPVPGVTTIIDVLAKPFLLPWAVGMTVEYIRERWEPDAAYDFAYIVGVLEKAKDARRNTSGKAAKTGTDAHNWIEKYIRAKMRGRKMPFKLPPQESPIFLPIDSFLKWEAAHDVEYLHTERRMINVQYLYSGTVDLLARVDGRLMVVDFKTSRAIYADYLMQIAAYTLMVEEEDKVRVDGGLIVRIPKDDAGFEVREVSREEMDPLFEAFLAAKRLYEFQKEHG